MARELEEDIREASPEATKSSCAQLAWALIFNTGRGMPVPEYTDYTPCPTDSCRRRQDPTAWSSRQYVYYYCNQEARYQGSYDTRGCEEWSTDMIELGVQPRENLLYPADERTVARDENGNEINLETT